MGANVDLGHGRVLAVQTVPYTASSAQAASPFGPQTFQIRVVASSDCHVKVGTGSLTATTSDLFLPAHLVDYFMVTPGERIAAVQAATDGLVTATPGTLNVTEL